MKGTTKKILLSTIAIVIFGLANSAQAYRVCEWVGGYWKNGYYHYAHKVCWNKTGYHCRWVRTPHGSYRNCW